MSNYDKVVREFADEVFICEYEFLRKGLGRRYTEEEAIERSKRIVIEYNYKQYLRNNDGEDIEFVSCNDLDYDGVVDWHFFTIRVKGHVKDLMGLIADDLRENAISDYAGYSKVSKKDLDYTFDHAVEWYNCKQERVFSFLEADPLGRPMSREEKFAEDRWNANCEFKYSHRPNIEDERWNAN